MIIWLALQSMVILLILQTLHCLLSGIFFFCFNPVSTTLFGCLHFDNNRRTYLSIVHVFVCINWRLIHVIFSQTVSNQNVLTIDQKLNFQGLYTDSWWGLIEMCDSVFHSMLNLMSDELCSQMFREQCTIILSCISFNWYGLSHLFCRSMLGYALYYWVIVRS